MKETQQAIATVIRLIQVILICLCLLYFSVAFAPLAECVVADNFFFDGLPINGTFQMLNPLHRMDLGQVPGADFHFFHGIGTLLLHRPFYLLLGSNLWASNVSIYVVGFMSFVLSLYVFLRGIGMGTYYAFLSLPFATLILYKTVHQLLYFKLNTPGVRSFFPVLAVGILLLQSPKEWWHKSWFGHYCLTILLGFLASITFFISVEHGMAFSLALLITIFVFGFFPGSVFSRAVHSFVFCLSLFLITVLFFFFSLDLAGKNH